MTAREKGERSREKLVAAMTDLAREKGYHATRVEDVCATAGVTKGSFFHHFASRDAVGIAAAEAWQQNTAAFFADADFTRHPGAKDRVLAYIDLRKSLLTGPVASYCCYAGTVVSETWASDAPVFHKARAAIDDHVEVIAAHVAQALSDAGKDPTRARDLSTFIQGTVQGALILAKAAGGAEPALACFDELSRHLNRELSPEDP
jgi:TetR/AcrR family transcriptional repressor of nem operon